MNISIINQIGSEENESKSCAMKNKNQAIFSFQKTEPATLLHNIN